ncbi:hypothetical protein XA68_17164 [Ophiocordyceps unilateralis]|uniref:Uncharacterized protein n=1 Tax=Ophiocordyceps unilateralis TaxID=268505 RepID=A0A2A9PKT7_OPHUN|nr:hypothetical protein XA68_17164 [Ophiocordyceps unilateralis]
MLGYELFFAHNHLANIVPEQDQLLRKVPKLVLDVEKICSPTSPKGKCPCLREIARGEPESEEYKLAEDQIRKGISAIINGYGMPLKQAIDHIYRFNQYCDNEKPSVEKPTSNPKSMPVEHPNEMKFSVYDILHRYTYCTYSLKEATGELVEKRHLARLLLQPEPKLDREDYIPFEMLISSAPFMSETAFGCWQEIQLLIPRNKKTSKKPRKRVRFADCDEDTEDSPAQGNLEEIKTEEFCQLIHLDAKACLCLTVQGDKLQRFLDSKPPKYSIDPTPSISLATVLRTHQLSRKMKGALAYILAKSVWQFYDSDWMKTRWTSETIHFMRYCSQGVFASKPYFAVRFGEDSDALEATSTYGEIHRYPRVCALGIMLVEIGHGSLLSQSGEGNESQSPQRRINDCWTRAQKISDEEQPWPDFDFAKYRTAVKNCLNPSIFDEAPFRPRDSNQEIADGRQKRRKVLYEQVVFPLEELVQGTGWKEQLHEIGPLRERLASPKPAPVPVQTQHGVRRAEERHQRGSQQWLKNIDAINAELKPTLAATIPRSRIRIAILDTGYDADATFCQPPARRNRLIKWKDFVDDATLPVDDQGHGTAMLSLAMRVAPAADFCVARVAKNYEELGNASDLVTEAIEWAQSECEADIISMSFGYTDDQQSISNAIHHAVSARNDSILFFAAAANTGANERELFPARHECVISIRGTNKNGHFLDFNPPRNPREGAAFGTLGLQVPCAPLSPESEYVYQTGTSIAAAIAAGIAGMLLGYVTDQTSKSDYQSVRRQLKRRVGMLAMFERIAKPSFNGGGYLYVAPWDLRGITDEKRWAMFQDTASRVS